MGERKGGREGGMTKRNMSVLYSSSAMTSSPQECSVKRNQRQHEICTDSGAESPEGCRE